jgi:hypothetical protein
MLWLCLGIETYKAINVLTVSRNVRRCMHRGEQPKSAVESVDDEATSGGNVTKLVDDIESKFNVNAASCMVFVANTECFLYRRHSLAVARQVCIQLICVLLYSVKVLTTPK